MCERPKPNDRTNAEQIESALEDVAWAVTTYYNALVGQGLPVPIAAQFARDYQLHLFSNRSL